jgi:tRNA (guanine37-N1)-methyltransferase
MKFDVLTLFPGFFEGPLSTSVLGRAIESGLVDVGLHDIRDHAVGKHRTVDDSPYGGGAGMVMMAEPIVSTLESLSKNAEVPVARTIQLSPSGRPFNQSIARGLADRAHEGSIVLICGRYEGIDCRVAQISCDDELSIGDYVLNGGELAALVIIEAVSRLIPGVLGNDQSAVVESLETGLLEYPQYTRPREFRGCKVPDVLLDGDHAAIAKWRQEQSLILTRDRRPDLLEKLELTDNEKKLLDL